RGHDCPTAAGGRIPSCPAGGDPGLLQHRTAGAVMTGHLRAAEKRVVAAVAEDRDALVALVSDLVARPSVTGEEAPAAAGVRDWLQAHGFDVIEQVIDPNSEVARRFPAERNLDARPNVVVRWEPAGHVAGSVRRRIVLN